MNLSDRKLLADNYSHIYIEKEALEYPLAKDILSRFPKAHLIEISHYKDIFNRSKQDFLMQKNAQSLILAVNHQDLIYPGARFCQSFDNEHFYYTSNIMNCIYDCEYCYLQGMYPSGNMVIFVNIEDYFTAASKILKEHSAYICISYDTDLLAIENLTHITQKWIDFTVNNPGLTIEIRTKSMFPVHKLNNSNHPNVIFAWTLSPREITAFEHNAPSLDNRINAIKEAINNDCTVRLCFDPMIYVSDYRNIYARCYQEVFKEIPADRIFDVSYGLFRISADYLKSMRKKRNCAITAYPYENINGSCSYEQKKSDEMLNFARLELTKYISPDKLYGI